MRAEGRSRMCYLVSAFGSCGFLVRPRVNTQPHSKGECQMDVNQEGQDSETKSAVSSC